MVKVVQNYFFIEIVIWEILTGENILQNVNLPEIRQVIYIW